MKYDTRRIFGSATAVALLLVLTACGGKETVASKSAKAFREAQAKGVQVGGGAAGHHGGAATDSAADAGTASGTDHSTMTGMDHSTMTGMDHSTMTASSGDMAGMDHSKKDMKSGQSMAGMDHSKMNMQGRQPMAGMDHSKMNMPSGQSMAGMDHSKMNMPSSQPMAGMDHSQMNMPAQQPMSGMDHSNMPGMQHGAAAPVIATPPTTNAEMQQMRPATTLRPDAFDAPVPVAVAEASKSAQGGSSEGQHTRGITPGQDDENPPTRAPGTRDGRQQAQPTPPSMDHSQHGQPTPAPPKPRAAATPKPKPAAATVYTCPMHPEVTSDKPGSCPKCGMTLVKKK